MTVLAPGLRYFDLHFRQQPDVIATAVIDHPAGAALVDPGPGSCLPALKAGLEAGGLSVRDLRAILLTHIHLDHAGATGALVQENPEIQVFVHERGAPHLVDPSKLVTSATRLFGAEGMAQLGAFLPVPAANITTLAGGERITAAGRTLDVAYTPGHASHHVSYFDPASRIAFVGDTAGISMPGSSYVLPPTPPPDIDLAAWEASAAKITAWHPETLFLTHFGPAMARPAAQLQELLVRLQRLATLAREALAIEESDEARKTHFVDRLRLDLQRDAGAAVAQRYETAIMLEHMWLGLSRYWQKRAATPASAAPTSSPASSSSSASGSLAGS
jgi:glyoxylase-like metal-dependent hydrolase (beta-lactamase superfamily II)